MEKYIREYCEDFEFSQIEQLSQTISGIKIKSQVLCGYLRLW